MVDVSVVVISYRTPELLCRCFEAIQQSEGITYEIVAVDNASHDGTVPLVKQRFPGVQLLESDRNLGFGAAHNVAFRHCRGKYIVLVNSDAFVKPDTLRRAVDLMKANPTIGIGGVKLIGFDGRLQHGARQFPSLLNMFLTITGLAARWPDSQFFGKADRTWADPDEPAAVDWVPGAFMIIPRELLEQVGYFNEKYFLYYEEIELCRRVKQAGYGIQYWPELTVVHKGGESARTVQAEDFSASAQQLSLWRMRSELIYFREQGGYLAAKSVLYLETLWQRLRHLVNRLRKGQAAEMKVIEASALVRLKHRAWTETQGGRVSPKKPW